MGYSFVRTIFLGMSGAFGIFAWTIRSDPQAAGISLLCGFVMWFYWLMLYLTELGAFDE